MTALQRVIIVASLVTAATSTASAQFGPNLNGLSVALSAGLPLGKFDEQFKTGFGVAIRSGGGDTNEPWSGRTSFSFERFPGNVTYDNVQFVTFGFDIVHHQSESGFYEFGGIGLYNTRFTVRSGTTPLGSNRSEQDFGFDGGVGLNIGSDEGLRGFVEFSATTVFTTGSQSSWFPIRLGVRF